MYVYHNTYKITTTMFHVEHYARFLSPQAQAAWLPSVDSRPSSVPYSVVLDCVRIVVARKLPPFGPMPHAEF